MVDQARVGVSHTWGRWTLEGDLGATLFTDNTDFRGVTRSQAPIVSTQGHLIYSFRPALWIAADGNYWTGGRVTTNGVEGTDYQRNSRLGVTVAFPVKRQQIRIAYSAGGVHHHRRRFPVDRRVGQLLRVGRRPQGAGSEVVQALPASARQQHTRSYGEARRSR